MNTIDLVRLYERGSSAQKLWALVLLLAVRDGATRVWYDPAQGERRLGYEIDGVEAAMVPPPEHLQAKLLQAVGKLIRYRSVWRFISWLFGGSAHRSAPLEGTFVAKVGGYGIPVTATFDMVLSRVVLRLSPETSAAPDAQNAIEFVFRNTPEADLRELPELPEEELQ